MSLLGQEMAQHLSSGSGICVSQNASKYPDTTPTCLQFQVEMHNPPPPQNWLARKAKPMGLWVWLRCPASTIKAMIFILSISVILRSTHILALMYKCTPHYKNMYTPWTQHENCKRKMFFKFCVNMMTP